MSTQDEDLVFRGIDGTECEEFIRSVKLRVRKEDRTRDNEWIVEFVSTCFAGKALRWFTKLDRDIRNDWDKLQEALLDEYPEADDISTIPTPAAAPTMSIVPAFSAPIVGVHRMGRIKLIPTNSSAGNYVSRTLDASYGLFLTCADASEALQIRFPANSAGPFEIEIMNSPSHQHLVAAKSTVDPVAKNDQIFFALAATSRTQTLSATAYASSYTSPGGVQSRIWKTAVDGSLVANWQQGTDTFTLSAVVYISTKRVFLLTHVDPLAADYCKARLVFEAT